MNASVQPLTYLAPRITAGAHRREHPDTRWHTRGRTLGLRLLMAAAMVLAWNTARAETPQVGESQAVNGQIADVGSTGIGLLMGAAEANPLGIITLGIKVAAYQQIKEAPPAEQPRLWGMYGAFGWGAAANNLCIIGTIASGGAFAALCPVLGVAAGMGVWNTNEAERDRATFDAMCRDAQAANPDLSCTYTESKT